MSKSFDIIMAGLISGIVALTTSFLGVAGTVIGAVLGAILYQIISIFVKEPLENSTVKKVEREIVYIIPLVLIALFLAIFIVALLHSYSFYYPDFLEFFKQLEEITNNNLVRFMGIGLIFMGIYPLLQPKSIKKQYGLIILILGVILLIRGLLDLDFNIIDLYTEMFGFFDVILITIIFLILVFIILKILIESVYLYRDRNKYAIIDDYSNPKTTRTQDSIEKDYRFKSEIKKEYYKNENLDSNDNFKDNDSVYMRGSDDLPNKDTITNRNRDAAVDNNLDSITGENVDNLDNVDVTEEDVDTTNNENIDKNIDKAPLSKNKTIKSSKTSTMFKNRKFFKR